MTGNLCNILLITLATAGVACAQTDFAKNVQNKLSEYYANDAGPKAYVTFNQPEYHPGDTAFFKAYLLNSAGNAFLKGWQVIDLFVVDENNSAVLRNRTSIKNGFGASQFAIPRNATEGRYTLIVAQPDLSKTSRHPVACRTSFIVSGKKVSKAPGTGTFAVYAEGGRLVDRVSNSIVVTGLTQGDSAIFESGQSKRQKIVISEGGIGKFSFTPQPNENYFIRHREKRIPIGPVMDTGITITVSPTKESNSIDISLHTTSANTWPALHLVCVSKNNLIAALPVKFESDGNASLAFSLNGLPSGVSRLSVLDENGNSYADRFFYKALPTLSSAEPDQTHTTRSIIDFEIALPKESQSRNVNGAVSVYRKDLFPVQHENTLWQMVMLEGLNTPVHLSPAMPEHVINDLLISANPTTDWKNIWSAKSSGQKPTFSPFFRGRIVFPNGIAARDSSLITFWFKNQDFIYQVYAPTQGKFSFPLFSEFGDDEVLYTVSHKNSHFPEARVVLDSLTVPTSANKSLMYSEKENPYAWFSSLRAAVEKSYGYFQNTTNREIVRPYVESIPTDASIPIEKFKDFASVAEMVNEVVPVVKARKSGNRYELRVFLREFAMHASGNPLVMIDGVVTDSIDYLMNMNPSEIKSLGVVNSRNKLIRYGALGRNGIITVETSRKEIQNLQSRKSVFVKGIDVPVEANVIKQIKDRTPSLRSTLYWDASVTLTKALPYTAQLQASDDVGEYVIMFSGMDEKGMPVEIMKSFMLKYRVE